MRNVTNNLFKIIGNNLVDDTESIRIYFFNFYKGFPQSYDYIANNKFIPERRKIIIINIFFKIRKIYDTLNSFAKYLKIKLARDTSVTTDLCLNNLDNYPEHLKINIIQDSRKYTFRLSDMMQLWSKSLTKSITFSPCPEIPRNPYTNIRFDKAVFFNSYMQLKKTSYTLPIILEFFWQSSMDIYKFELDAYTLLKEYSVNNYICESCDNTLFYDVINMLSSLGHHINYRTIHNDLFTKKQHIVKNMKPYLKTFLLSQESCNKFKKRLFRRKTIDGLKNFFYANPTFGRRVVRRAINYSENIRNTTVNNIGENTGEDNNDGDSYSEIDSEINISDTNSSVNEVEQNNPNEDNDIETNSSHRDASNGDTSDGDTSDGDTSDDGIFEQ